MLDLLSPEVAAAAVPQHLITTARAKVIAERMLSVASPDDVLVVGVCMKNLAHPVRFSFQRPGLVEIVEKLEAADYVDDGVPRSALQVENSFISTTIGKMIRAKKPAVRRAISSVVCMSVLRAQSIFLGDDFLRGPSGAIFVYSWMNEGGSTFLTSKIITEEKFEQFRQRRKML